MIKKVTRKIARINRNVFTRIHDPQILSQIDAAELTYSLYADIMLTLYSRQRRSKGTISIGFNFGVYIEFEFWSICFSASIAIAHLFCG